MILNRSVLKFDFCRLPCNGIYDAHRFQFFSDCKGEMVDNKLVEAVQDHAQVMMTQYMTHAHPQNATRFGKALLLLPTLRSISSEVTENLFFMKPSSGARYNIKQLLKIA